MMEKKANAMMSKEVRKAKKDFRIVAFARIVGYKNQLASVSVNIYYNDVGYLLTRIGQDNGVNEVGNKLYLYTYNKTTIHDLRAVKIEIDGKVEFFKLNTLTSGLEGQLEVQTELAQLIKDMEGDEKDET